MEIINIILITLISGVGGTGVGGIVGALFRKDSKKTVSLLLSFAAGVMLSVVCFDLVVNAINPENSNVQTNIFVVCAGIIIGVAVVYLLNTAIDRRTDKEVPHKSNTDHPKTADDLDELIHSNHYAQHASSATETKKSLFVAGIVMASAIALHNMPEGMTIGASMAVGNDIYSNSGILLAILIGLHNIPEGMAIVVPLISGGMRKLNAVAITAASGFPTVIGAILGYAIGDVGPLGLALSLSFASGAMLYVVFGEILPQSILMHRSKLPAFSAIAGILVGLLIIYL